MLRFYNRLQNLWLSRIVKIPEFTEKPIGLETLKPKKRAARLLA